MATQRDGPPRTPLKPARGADVEAPQAPKPPAPAWWHGWCEGFVRPDVVHHKTVPEAWPKLRSRWRYVHALTFFVGFPIHLLRRIWPMLLFNMTLAAIVSGDHISRTLRGVALLPTLNPMVTDRLDPELRFLLISVSLMQSMRFGRVYERWWNARRGFASVGSAALSLTQRAAAWAGADRPQLAEEFARWGTIWHQAVLQVLTASPTVPKDAELTPAEAAVYAGSRKGRQLAVLRLLQLVSSAGFNPTRTLTMENIIQSGVAGSGVCTGIKYQSMPYSLSLLGTGFTQLFLVLLPVTALPTQLHMRAESAEVTRDVLFTVSLLLLLLFFVNLLLLGADEVINQMEDPFPWLPLEDMAASTKRDSKRALKEAALLRALHGTGDWDERAGSGDGGAMDGGGCGSGGADGRLGGAANSGGAGRGAAGRSGRNGGGGGGGVYVRSWVEAHGDGR